MITRQPASSPRFSATPVCIKLALTALILMLTLGPARLTTAIANAEDKPKRVEVDHKSPEGIAKSLLKAVMAGDFHGIVNTYEPKLQNEMAKGMVMMAAMAAFNPQMDQATVMPILMAHGLTPADLPQMGPDMEAKAEAAVKKIENVPAFAGDMIESMPGISEQMIQLPKAAHTKDAAEKIRLENLKIKGDKATAKVTIAGKPLSEENKGVIHFVRVDKKWYFGDK